MSETTPRERYCPRRDGIKATLRLALSDALLGWAMNIAPRPQKAVLALHLLKYWESDR